MEKNYSSIDHLLTLANKEMGPVGSSTQVDDEKLKVANNFSAIENFIHTHDEEVNKHVEVIPDQPNIPSELENIGVKAVSNPSFIEPKAVPVDSPISDEGLHILEQVKQNKDPDHNKSWFWRFLHKKNRQKEV